MTRARKALIVFGGAAGLYLASYVAFRQTHVEIWANDGRPYVIVPAGRSALYYFYRPAMYVDGLTTGMRFHIGPHR
jgi:hypothetical protein